MSKAETEHRLTALESQVSSLAVRSSAHGKDIGAIKDQLREDEAVEQASDNRWSTREKVIAATASIILAASALLAIFHI